MRRILQDDDNKYSRGVVAVAAGSDRYPGAAILTVGGARRGNAGFVKFLSQEKRLQNLVISKYPDVVPVESLEGTRVDALVVGPGRGSVKKIPEHLPLVLDGESIQFIREQNFSAAHPMTVITPHEGELRFCGVEVKTPLSKDERKNIALEIAREFDLIVVLKGHHTIVASPDGETFIDEIGGPELATAGSGDVLAGLIGSMLVSIKDGGSALDLVSRAVTLHSRAGANARERLTSVTSLDIVDSLALV